VEKGDENTTFSHNFSNHRKRINTILEMKKVDISKENNLQEIANLRVSYFQYLHFQE
jgi:hypothetical protein